MMIAGAAVMKRAWAEMKNASERLFHGEVTVSKKDCWLVGAILVLTGIAVGFIYAPLTHGVSISFCSNNGSNNGNNSGNNNGNGEDGILKVAGEGTVCKSKQPKKPEQIEGKKNKRKKDKCCKRGMKGAKR